MIDFNIAPFAGNEFQYMKQAVESRKISGDGPFTKKCQMWMNEKFGAGASFLTPSCTASLEMAAALADIRPGDEVILPSYTFCSTADAFVLRGAKLVFVDIRPDTMNIDESKIEKAITDKTRAIAVVHYAGVACEMDTILALAHKYDLTVIEDAAQAVGSYYKGKPLGTIGDFGCYSFHETKNFSMGEGGALLLKDPAYREKAEILREKGTDRSRFFRGEIDKYTWQDYGSSYLPSDLGAAYLWAQLEIFNKILADRMSTWMEYDAAFRPLAADSVSAPASARVGVPCIPEGCAHNAHMYYLKLRNLEERTDFIRWMNEADIHCVFHYIPLHSAPAGLKFGRFDGEDVYTTKESERLVRLPLYYGLSKKDCAAVIDRALAFLQR